MASDDPVPASQQPLARKEFNDKDLERKRLLQASAAYDEDQQLQWALRASLAESSPQDKAPRAARWECPACGEINRVDRKTCNNCGKAIGSIPPPPPPKLSPGASNAHAASIQQQPCQKLVGQGASATDLRNAETRAIAAETALAEVSAREEEVAKQVAKLRARVYESSSLATKLAERI